VGKRRRESQTENGEREINAERNSERGRERYRDKKRKIIWKKIMREKNVI
jgi:hypothetical protein